MLDLQFALRKRQGWSRNLAPNPDFSSSTTIRSSASLQYFLSRDFHVDVALSRESAISLLRDLRKSPNLHW
jgi:hypothetical protein